MKRIFVLLGLAVMLAARIEAADGGFTSALSRTEAEAAGVAGLSAAQKAALDRLVESYRDGSLAAARRATEEALAARRASEAEAARAVAEANALRAEAEKAKAAQADATQKAENLTFLAKAKGVLKPERKSEPLVESTIPGKFRGWAPRQVFVLANGQRWQVANAESYYAPVTDNPRVQIVPATAFGHWMRFPDLDAQVRVTYVGD